MRISLIATNKAKYHVNPSQFIINLFWYSLIIVDIVRKCTYNEMTVNFIRNGLYIIVLAYVMYNAFCNKRIGQIVIPGLIFLFFLGLSLLFNPSLISIVEQNVILFFLRGLTGFYLALNIVDWKQIITGIVQWHWVGLFYSILVFTSGFSHLYNYMSFSYGLLVPAFITLVFGFVERKIVYLLSGCVMLSSLFIFGARGPLLCIFVALFFLFFEIPEKRIEYKKLIVSLLLLFIIVVIVVNFDNIIIFLSRLYPQARNIYSAVSGQFTGLSGRDILYSRVLGEILNNPFLPRGLLADRILLTNFINVENIYPHNFILEVIYQFGVFGCFFLVWFTLKFIWVYYLLLHRNDFFLKMAFTSFFVTALTKLMISGSYISDMQAWFAFGCLGSMLMLFSHKRM